MNHKQEIKIAYKAILRLKQEHDVPQHEISLLVSIIDNAYAQLIGQEKLYDDMKRHWMRSLILLTVFNIVLHLIK